MSNWTVQEITVKTTKGDEPVAGWANGLFALDFRLYDTDEAVTPGWNLTHIPTGYTTCAILAERREAMRVADRVASEIGWDFTEADDAKLRARLFHDLMEDEPSIARISPMFSPMFAASL